jgi:hypothetical protein
VAASERVQLKAIMNIDTGISEDVTTDAIWSSSDTDIADIAAPGLIAAKAPGTVAIQALKNGISKLAMVTVYSPTSSPLPSSVPTAAPTAIPTGAPTAEPTASQTAIPTAAPTETAEPTAAPTGIPTASPDTQPPVPGGSGTLTISSISGGDISITWIIATDDQTLSQNIVYLTYLDGVLTDTHTFISGINLTGLSTGNHEVRVDVMDQAGNVASYAPLDFTL